MAASEYADKIAGGQVGILLIHGLCGTPSEMRFAVSRLSEQAMKPAQLHPAAANARTGDEKAA